MPQTGLEIELNPALISEGFHLQRRSLLSLERARKRQGAQGEREYAAESNHSALGANQNQRSLPSGISSHFNRTGVPELRPSWHVNCGHPFRNKLMAAKMNMSKLLQEIRGFAEISNRRSQRRSPELRLALVGSRVFRSALRKRRLSIRIDMQDRTDTPYRVKINYVKPDPGPAPMRPAP